MMNSRKRNSLHEHSHDVDEEAAEAVEFHEALSTPEEEKVDLPTKTVEITEVIPNKINVSPPPPVDDADETNSTSTETVKDHLSDTNETEPNEIFSVSSKPQELVCDSKLPRAICAPSTSRLIGKRPTIPQPIQRSLARPQMRVQTGRLVEYFDPYRCKLVLGTFALERDPRRRTSNRTYNLREFIDPKDRIVYCDMPPNSRNLAFACASGVYGWMRVKRTHGNWNVTKPKLRYAGGDRMVAVKICEKGSVIAVLTTKTNATGSRIDLVDIKTDKLLYRLRFAGEIYDFLILPIKPLRIVFSFANGICIQTIEKPKPKTAARFFYCTPTLLRLFRNPCNHYEVVGASGRRIYGFDWRTPRNPIYQYRLEPNCGFICDLKFDRYRPQLLFVITTDSAVYRVETTRPKDRAPKKKEPTKPPTRTMLFFASLRPKKKPIRVWSKSTEDLSSLVTETRRMTLSEEVDRVFKFVDKERPQSQPSSRRKSQRSTVTPPRHISRPGAPSFITRNKPPPRPQSPEVDDEERYMSLIPTKTFKTHRHPFSTHEEQELHVSTMMKKGVLISERIKSTEKRRKHSLGKIVRQRILRRHQFAIDATLNMADGDGFLVTSCPHGPQSMMMDFVFDTTSRRGCGPYKTLQNSRRQRIKKTLTRDKVYALKKKYPISVHPPYPTRELVKLLDGYGNEFWRNWIVRAVRDQYPYSDDEDVDYSDARDSDAESEDFGYDFDVFDEQEVEEEEDVHTDEAAKDRTMDSESIGEPPAAERLSGTIIFPHQSLSTSSRSFTDDCSHKNSRSSAINVSSSATLGSISEINSGSAHKDISSHSGHSAATILNSSIPEEEPTLLLPINGRTASDASNSGQSVVTAVKSDESMTNDLKGTTPPQASSSLSDLNATSSTTQNKTKRTLVNPAKERKILEILEMEREQKRRVFEREESVRQLSKVLNECNGVLGIMHLAAEAANDSKSDHYYSDLEEHLPMMTHYESLWRSRMLNMLGLPANGEGILHRTKEIVDHTSTDETRCSSLLLLLFYGHWNEFVKRLASICTQTLSGPDRGRPILSQRVQEIHAVYSRLHAICISLGTIKQKATRTEDVCGKCHKEFTLLLRDKSVMKRMPLYFELVLRYLHTVTNEKASIEQYRDYLLERKGVRILTKCVFAISQLTDRQMVDFFECVRKTTRGGDALVLTGLVRSRNSLKAIRGFYEATHDYETTSILMMMARSFKIDADKLIPGLQQLRSKEGSDAGMGSTDDLSEDEEMDMRDEQVGLEAALEYLAMLDAVGRPVLARQISQLFPLMPPRPIYHQLSLSCTYCYTPYGRAQLFGIIKEREEEKTRTPEEKTRAPMDTIEDDDVDQVHPLSGSACPKCRKPLPKCSVCLRYMFVNMINITAFEQQWVVCRKCSHGGHLSHITNWFDNYAVCPVKNCACRCCGGQTSKNGMRNYPWHWFYRNSRAHTLRSLYGETVERHDSEDE